MLKYSIGDSRSTNFVQIMVVGWPLTFLRQGQICALEHLYEETVGKSFCQNVLKTNGWNIQSMIKFFFFFFFSYNKYFVPRGYIHV